jgi:hypothetical protein
MAQWHINSIQDITWDFPDVLSNVKIELSRDNKNTWEIIISSTPNNGIYQWQVTGPETSLGIIRISGLVYTDTDTSEIDFTDIVDVSDDVFYIIEEEVSIVYIDPIYADTIIKPLYQKTVPFTSCSFKVIDNILSAQDFIPEEPMRGLIITSAGNLSIKLIKGYTLIRKWPADTIINNMVIKSIGSYNITTSASQAKGIYPLW